MYLDEKNEKVKEQIRKKMTDYLDRAEKIKEFLKTSGWKSKPLVAEHGTPASNKAAMGGGTSGSTEPEDDPERNRMRAGLEGNLERTWILGCLLIDLYVIFRGHFEGKA